MHEGAPFDARLGTEAVDAEEDGNGGHAVGLQDHLVATRLQVGSVRRGAGFGCGELAGPGTIEVADPARGLVGLAGGVVSLVDAIQDGGRRAAGGPLPGRVGEGHLTGLRRGVTGSQQATTGVDEPLDERRPLGRSCGDGRLVVVGHLR